MLRKFSYAFFFLLVLSLTGCKKYLDVKPEDSYTDDEVFSNAATIQQALNGLYVGLTADDLYGAQLTLEAVEIIAGRYNTDILLGTYTDIAKNYYIQGAAGSTFDAIWSKAYALVLKTNNFIGQLAKTKGVVSEAQAALLTGEATALRAFIQFDMLRLYGPQYLGEDSVAAIPYYTEPDAKLQPIIPFGQVISKVLADLTSAEQLLANDPILTKGVVTTGYADFYNSFRNRRMNYYAVKALEARVNLYAGHIEAAHAAALAVVNAADHVFPWTDYTAIVTNGNPDRIFSSEVIFGMDNRNLYALQAEFFSSTLLSYQMLVPTANQLNDAFEGNDNDYRLQSNWLPSNYGYNTFYKYADLTDQTKSWRYFQPLIRKSELYYILAETDPDPAQGVAYLNTVRYNRGLPDLPDDAQLTDYGGEIEKEYIKEFYGEGQLFFYDKRINPWWTDIPTFNIPLPVSETNLR